MKNTIILLAFLLLGSSVAFAQWQPYGQTLTGENDGDRFGNDIELSGNGKTLVIGVADSPDFGIGSETNSNAGKIEVYEFVNDSWAQLGSDIDGGTTANLFGIKVAISGNGLVIAGAGGSEQPFTTTRIFEFVNNDWVQKGNAIQNLNQIDNVKNLSLNEDGSIVAIGSTGRNGGEKLGAVAIYKFENNDWQLLGAPVYGDENGDNFGLEVDLTSDGMRFVSGALGNDENGDNTGVARVYAFNGSSWVQVGTDIFGDNTFDRLGSNVSINNLGDRIAIVAAFSGSNNRVDVYENNNGNWQQLGNSIFKPSTPNLPSSALNGAGDIIVIGAPSEPLLRILKFNGSSWNQINESSIGGGVSEIAIDDTGGIVGAGSPMFPLPGQVTFFVDPTLGVEDFEESSSKFLLYPNPSSGVVTFESLDEPILSFSVFSTNGYLVKSERTLLNHHKCKVDLTDLAKGMYFVILTTSSHNYNAKIILK